MSQICFVLFSIGSLTNHKRLVWAVWSLLYSNKWIKGSSVKILVYTDEPSFFSKQFESFREEELMALIEIIPLSEDKIRLMQGDFSFVHRIKICLLKEVLQHYKCKVIYLDADTVVVSDLLPVASLLDDNHTMMHEKEYPLLNSVGESEKFINAYNALVGVNTRDYRLTQNHWSYNAGVVGLSYSNMNLLDDILSIVDKVYPLCTHFATEQYAFSIVFSENTNIITTDIQVYHYWHVVKKEIFDDLFKKNKIGNVGFKSPVCIKQKIEYDFKWQSKLLFNAFEKREFINTSCLLFKIIIKNPNRGLVFYRDVLYHIKRFLYR